MRKRWLDLKQVETWMDVSGAGGGDGAPWEGPPGVEGGRGMPRACPTTMGWPAGRTHPRGPQGTPRAARGEARVA